MKPLAFLLIAIVAAVPQTQADSNQRPGAAASKPVQQKEIPQEAASAETNEKTATNEQPPLDLKNKSSFEMKGDSHNPFWPIGWRPTAKLTGGTDQADGEIAASAFRVSSITLDPKAHFAILNGKIVQEGQEFALQVGTKTFPIKVKAIEDGRVILSRHDQEIVIPLIRK